MKRGRQAGSYRGADSFTLLQTLAEAIAEASKATGAQVDLFQFPEILSDEVLAKMHAAVSLEPSPLREQPTDLALPYSPRPTTPSSSPMTSRTTTASSSESPPGPFFIRLLQLPSSNSP
jgi:hypothetical protein